jgi:hypothetical protein
VANAWEYNSHQDANWTGARSIIALASRPLAYQLRRSIIQVSLLTYFYFIRDTWRNTQDDHLRRIYIFIPVTGGQPFHRSFSSTRFCLLDAPILRLFMNFIDFR